jgi:hypothetical protein
MCCILRADPMAKAHLVPSRTLGVLLSATLVLACQSEQKKVTPTSTAGATGAPTGAPTTPPPLGDPAVPPGVVPPGTGSKVELASGGTILALTAESDILGHFVIANGSDLLRDIKTQLMIPKYAGFLEEAALRSVVSMALEQRGSMAQAFDLAAPMGCALVDPQQPEPKVSCTFGYRGGAKQFVTDIGEQNKQPDGSGHVAAYSVDGKSVFVDEVGGQVVVSSGKDTFSKTSAYLERNLIGRARDINGDLEVVVYVATAFDRYRDIINPLLDQFSGMGAATPPTTGNPAIDGAFQAFTAYQKRSSKQGFERIAEISQFTLFFSVEPAGVMVGGAAFPKPGSRAAQEAAQFGGLKLDSATAGAAPSGTALLAAFHTNPRVHEMASVVEMRKLVAEIWAPVSGRDAASIEAAFTAYQAENAALYDGQAMFALANEPGAPVALMTAAHLAPGKTARDSWKAWSASFTPQTVLGATFSQYLSWKFTPDAATVDGVPVDRWTIEPGPAVGKQVESMPADAKVMIDKVLGGLFLHIDRAEVGGHVVHTVAPKAENNFMKRAIAAVQGKDNVGAQAGFAKVVQRDPDAVGVMALDVKQVLNLVRNAANYGAKPGNLPNLGTDLADFFATFRYTTDGTSAMEFVVSQQMIDQIKAIVPN